MERSLTQSQWDHYLAVLSGTHRILGPVREPGKGAFSDTDRIGYGTICTGGDLVLDRKSWASPKEAVFPVREVLIRWLDGQAHVPETTDAPIALFVRPCDIHGLDRLDTIFLANGPEPDWYYGRRRRRVRFILIECTTGFDSCFCVSMNANRSDAWDAAFRQTEDGVLLNLRDPDLQAAFDAAFPPGAPDAPATAAFEPAFIERNRQTVTVPPVDRITPDLFEHPLWTEYTARCIACGRCNTSCVTCSCFSMQDVPGSDDGSMAERRRVWSGCHVDGFSQMAGGHDFRRKNGERMRFKTLHKINDFHRRFGRHMCVGCGRCDDVCPEYISFPACIGKLSAIVSEKEAAPHA